jgi:hypothetical protein
MLTEMQPKLSADGWETTGILVVNGGREQKRDGKGKSHNGRVP